MVDGISISVQGIEELKAEMRKLAQSVPPEKVEPLLIEGAQTIRDTAKLAAPGGPTGNLKKSLIAKFLPSSSFGQPRTALAGFDRRKAPHAWLVEFGSPGRYAKKGKHPGKYSGPMPANPVMRNAWDSTKDWVLSRIIHGLDLLIGDSVKK